MFSEFNVLPRSKKISLNDDLDYKLAFIKHEFFEQYGYSPVDFKYHREKWDANNCFLYSPIKVPEQKNEIITYYCYYYIDIKVRTLSNLITYQEMLDTIVFLLRCCNVNIFKVNYHHSRGFLIPICYISEPIPTHDEMLMEEKLKRTLELSKMSLNFDLSILNM